MKLRILMIVVTAILGVSCREEKKQDPAVKAPVAAVASDEVTLTGAQLKNAGVLLGMPEQREMHSSLKVSGVVDVPPQHMVSVSFPLGGYLRKTSMIPGMRVSKGSVLAVLEDQQYIQLQQDYLTAKDQLQFAAADYERQKGLNETKASSDKVFQQARTAFNSQQILVRSLAEKLRLIGLEPGHLNAGNISRSIVLRSPINGYVSKVNVNIGKYVMPADEIFELINPEDLHVKLTVFENDAVQLKTGQQVICVANNHPEVSYLAKVYLVTPNIGNERTTEVHCHLDEHAKGLLPGTYLSATIALNKSKVTAVPEDAVVKWQNKYFLFAEAGNQKFKMLPIETGNTSNGYIEIKTVLPAKPVVVRNAYTLLMKLKNNAEEG